MIHRPRPERRAGRLSFLAKLSLLVTRSSARSPRGPPPAHTRLSFAEWFMRTLTSCHDPSDWPYKRFAYLQPGLLPGEARVRKSRQKEAAGAADAGVMQIECGEGEVLKFGGR